MWKISPVIFLLAVTWPSAFAKTHHSNVPKSVKGSGCVEQAVENSCHVVIDSKTGELYNLLFPAKVPKSGTAIEFTGTKHTGPHSCVQGKPVKVSKWKKEKGIKCPPPVYAQVGR